MNITTLEVPLIKVGRILFLQAIENTNIFYQEISIKLIER
jgi:hypothetical protein